jgi:hypothetical protein
LLVPCDYYAEANDVNTFNPATEIGQLTMIIHSRRFRPVINNEQRLKIGCFRNSLRAWQQRYREQDSEGNPKEGVVKTEGVANRNGESEVPFRS